MVLLGDESKQADFLIDCGASIICIDESFINDHDVASELINEFRSRAVDNGTV